MAPKSSDERRLTRMHRIGRIDNCDRAVEKLPQAECRPSSNAGVGRCPRYLAARAPSLQIVGWGEECGSGRSRRERQPYAAASPEPSEAYDARCQRSTAAGPLHAGVRGDTASGVTRLLNRPTLTTPVFHCFIILWQIPSFLDCIVYHAVGSRASWNTNRRCASFCIEYCSLLQSQPVKKLSTLEILPQFIRVNNTPVVAIKIL